MSLEPKKQLSLGRMSIVLFCCHACDAAPELVADGAAKISVVRHRPGCELLITATRNRCP